MLFLAWPALPRNWLFRVHGLFLEKMIQTVLALKGKERTVSWKNDSDFFGP